MLEQGGSHDTVPLMFLVGVNTGVSQICCAGPDASVALQIQGCDVGILAVIHVGFFFAGWMPFCSQLSGRPGVGLSSSTFGNKEQGKQCVWDSRTTNCVLG